MCSGDMMRFERFEPALITFFSFLSFGLICGFCPDILDLYFHPEDDYCNQRERKPTVCIHRHPSLRYTLHWHRLLVLLKLLVASRVHARYCLHARATSYYLNTLCVRYCKRRHGRKQLLEHA